jgi:PPOX class probable FMN-dependent enzyme
VTGYDDATVKTPHLITTLDELARHYPAPSRTSRSKTRDHLSEDMQRWLSRAPFFVLASRTAHGVDCSPRGDAPGQAFRVLDAHTLAIPDRRGNNRIETLRNLLTDPWVGLVFLIPGIEEAVRIKGRASISIEPALLDSFALDGIPPATVILVHVSSAYVQNARAVRSAHLWDDHYRIDGTQVPSAAALSNLT